MIDILQKSGTTLDSVVLFSAMFYGKVVTFHNKRSPFSSLISSIDWIQHSALCQKWVFRPDHISCVDKSMTLNMKC